MCFSNFPVHELYSECCQTGTFLTGPRTVCPPSPPGAAPASGHSKMLNCLKMGCGEWQTHFNKNTSIIQNYLGLS